MKSINYNPSIHLTKMIELNVIMEVDHLDGILKKNRILLKSQNKSYQQIKRGSILSPKKKKRFHFKGSNITNEDQVNDFLC